MRRPWIKVETATPDKPEICAIATGLRMDEDAVIGKLVRLWSWVEVNRVAANDLGVTKEFLDKLVGRKGFANALVACGWLLDNDGRLSLRNLERHNGGSAKVRALTAQRVALHRSRKRIAPPQDVSETLHVQEGKPADAPDINNDTSVKRDDKTLSDNERLDVNHGVEASQVGVPLVQPQSETIVDELPAKKQRSKAGHDADQPLLF